MAKCARGENMSKILPRLFIFILIPVFVSSACLSSAASDMQGSAEQIAERTWVALQKSFTATYTPTDTDTPGPDTATPTNTTTSTATETLIPSLTPRPSTTATDTPTATLIPTVTPIYIGGGGGGSGGSGTNPTSTPAPTATPSCYLAQLNKIVTVPDQTVLPAGTRFTRIWRIKNIGLCTWGANFRFAFHSGDPFGAPLEMPLPAVVSPGQVVDIAQDMVAPGSDGIYSSRWRLVDLATNVSFGNGVANDPFGVTIGVKTPINGLYFNYVNNLCTAKWVNGSGKLLPCPGKRGDPSGFVGKANLRADYAPQIPRTLLYTFPEKVIGGSVIGYYPYVIIPSSAKFIGEVGCIFSYTQCDVTFQLYYQVYGNSPKLYGEWHEVHDDLATQFEIPLDGLKTQAVSFQFIVTANNAPAQAAAFWDARIVIDNPSP